MAAFDGDMRADELEILQSMYNEDELRTPSADDPYTFTLRFDAEPAHGSDESVACELACSLPAEYPAVDARIDVRSVAGVTRARRDDMLRALSAMLKTLEPEEMRVLAAVTWTREHAAEYATAPATPAAASATAAPAPRKGLMREWCSFVSLYKVRGFAPISLPRRADSCAPPASRRFVCFLARCKSRARALQSRTRTAAGQTASK